MPTLNIFVEKVQTAQASISDIYTVDPTGSTARRLIWAMFGSFSVPLFYAVVTGTVLLAWRLVFQLGDEKWPPIHPDTECSSAFMNRRSGAKKPLFA